VKTICIIPARSGSTRIPNKNIKLFHGKPIIAYSIENALNSKLFDDIYVSTDSGVASNIALSYGINVIVRPPELAVNEIGTQDVLRHACIHLGLANDDLVMGMYATCPLLPLDAIIHSYAEYLASDKAYCQTSKYKYKPGEVVAVTNLFEDIGALYWGLAAYFKGELPLKNNTCHYVLEDKYCCDINTPEDWTRAEQMYEELDGH